MQLTQLQKLVDAMEEQEAKLLSWGDTGGKFSQTEIEEICCKIVPEIDFEEALDTLEQRAIIYPVYNGLGQIVGYRSRMAHAVHLYRNLRQWMHNQTLNSSRTLVSDFRFLRRTRRYPIRDHDINDLLDTWRKKQIVSPSIENSIREQVGTYSLSGFQKRSTERILQAWPMHRARVKYPSATIVCSGTGSGKSMAFYLPALSCLLADLANDSDRRVRILAIYPRNELLKDQFNETWRACKRLESMAISCAGRKIRLGALFGNIPEKANNALDKPVYTNTGLINCMTEGCDGAMLWNKEDVERSVEILTCSHCGEKVDGEEVALTRTSMDKSPPDIVFTTTEMLNQRMGQPIRQKLFGINSSKPIPLVLLDEVHTYGGNQGAQTAFLLRRWMKLARTSPHFVGLSATLTDAESFFSRLTSTNPSRVRLVEPLEDEMTEEGAEYLLALRGDPVSQTALLSTTIQTSMLTRRVLDHYQAKPSKGMWGSKTFIFTDDLDVTNRLYSQLADAEGWWQRGSKLVPNSNGPLAQLRNPNRENSPSRSQLSMLGQDWSALQHNGFSLDFADRANVSRTSSQDSGVQSNSDMVVATASLEVGYNDPSVGAVIQHKSPRAVASYIQRKGRAGRTREMRPWMIAILSDFGRDRETYQNYEKLLDPEIKLQGLPIANIHIQKMQAAMATLNWLETKVAGLHAWTKMNFPRTSGYLDPKLASMHDVIEEVLKPGLVQDEFFDYLQNTLQLADMEMSSVLWQAPRSVMMEFLPTVRRRLHTQWGRWDEAKGELLPWKDLNTSWGSPVPEFIPDQLFSDLNLPTIMIHLDRGPLGLKTEGMHFFQALKEFAPGRLSKRFSVHSGQSSDWVLPYDYFPSEADDGSEKYIDVNDAFGSNWTDIGEYALPSGNEVKVIKPYQIITNTLFSSQEIADTSNAMLNWYSAFETNNSPEQHEPPNASLWKTKLSSLDFYTHRSMTPLNVTRFTNGSVAEFKFKRTGTRAKVQFQWHEKNVPVAIGTSQNVDAIEFRFSIDKCDLQNWLEEKSLLAALRTSFFQDRIRASPIFDGNSFTADWIFECFLAAFMAEASTKNISLELAIENVAKGSSALSLTDMPYVLFQQNLSMADESPNENELELADQRLQRDLVALLENTEIVEEVSKIAETLHKDLISDSEFIQWCFTILGNTLAAAVKQTVTTLIPDSDERSLLADPYFDPGKKQHSIWLSEVDSGGTGIVTQIQDLNAEDPLEFLNVYARQLQSSDYEQVDDDLVSLLAGYEENENVRSAFAQVRTAEDLSSRISANRLLKKRLTSEGFHYSHSFASVLHSRILKSGSTESSDRELVNHLAHWRHIQQQVNLELPVNIVAFLIAFYNYNSTEDKEVIFREACSIQSVLWPRGAQLRQSALQFYNPFMGNSNNRTERKIAAMLCLDDTRVVSIINSSWHTELRDELSHNGRVDLCIPSERHGEINSIIATLHTTPIDMYGLLVYARITSIRSQVQNSTMRIELAESIF